MSSTYRGSFAAFLQSESFDFDPTRGYVHRLDFKGLSSANMLALQGDYVNSGIACRLTFAHGLSTLEVDDSTAQYTLDTWEVEGSEVNLDLLQHPTILAMQLDNKDTRTLRKEFTDADKNWDDIYSQMNDTTNGLVLESFYNLYLRGSTEFEDSCYVIRHTFNVPNRWSGNNAADVGVNKLYTAAQLVGQSVGSIGELLTGWSNPCPDRLITKINAVTTELGAAPSGYLTSWKKGPAREGTIANNRVGITMEYVLQKWSTVSYFTR